MALYDGFFDAYQDEETGEYDRDYSSGDFTQYFGQIIGSGVCIHNAPDSFKVRLEDGAAVLGPGYLFIRGFWLKNDGDYTIPLDGTGTIAIAAALNMGKKMIELEVRGAAQADSDSLVLALINMETGAVTDTRRDTAICGVIDSYGEMSKKLEWATNYIDTEIETKLQQVESAVNVQIVKLEEKTREVGEVVNNIALPPVGTIKFSAASDMGEEWLRCDGRFISKEEYPELISLLFDMPGSAIAEDLDFYWEKSRIENFKYEYFTISCITHGNGMFVGMLYGEDAPVYSQDGNVWKLGEIFDSASYHYFNGIAYGKGVFVAVGNEDRPNQKKSRVRLTVIMGKTG